MSALLKTAKAHRALTFLLILEVLFLAGLLAVSLIRPQVTQVISGESLQPTGALPVTHLGEEGVTVFPQEPVERCTVFSQPIPLPSGAYEVEIQYQSVTNPQAPSYNMYDCAGWVDLNLPSNTYALQTNPISLSDDRTTAQGRFWLRMGAGAEDLTLEINHYGTGSLTIQQVEIRECVEYRAARILGFLVLFAGIDFLLVLLFLPKLLPFSRSTRYILLGIVLIGFFSSLTFFMDYLMRHGNDLEFHLNRIVSLAQALQDGQIPQRIETEMLNGYGYPNPLFYGEIFFLLPALLVLLAVPIHTAYQVYGCVISLATASIAFWCFHKMAGDWKKALLGSALYTLSICRLICLTVRGAVGEYTAMTFLPLIVYGFYKIYTASDDRRHTLMDCLPIILGLTGILQSHMLTCEMAALFILLLVVIFWKKTFQPQRFWALAKSALLTFLINAWFLVPFLQSMVTMNLRINDPTALSDVELQSAYLVQLFTLSPTAFGNTFRSAYQEMPMSVGPGLLIALFAFLFFCIRATEHSNKQKLVPLFTFFAFGGLSLFLASNLIPWTNLVHISLPLARLAGMVQFPMRYLTLGAAFLSAGTVLLLVFWEREFSLKRTEVLMGVLLLVTLFSAGKMVTTAPDQIEPWYVNSAQALNTHQVVSGEYLLQGTDIIQLEERLVLTGEGVTSGEMTREGTRSQLWCENASGAESYLDLPLLAYDNYQAHGEDGTALSLTVGENNRIRVILPAGYEGTVTVEYRVPLLWRICEGMSLLSLMVLMMVTVRERKKEKGPSLSLHQNLPTAESGEGVENV